MFKNGIGFGSSVSLVSAKIQGSFTAPVLAEQSTGLRTFAKIESVIGLTPYPFGCLAMKASAISSNVLNVTPS